MDLLTSNKVAIITGASRGIGRATAIVLAKEGAKVVINYLSSEEKAHDVVQEIKESGGQAIAVKADVAQSDDVKRLTEETIEQFGSIDILVNNAGILIQPGDWKNISDEDWQRTLDVNLKGVFNCIQVVAPYMLRQRRGRIVNISSTYGIFGAANVVAYVAAKAGVLTLTRTFAKELAPYVTVNAIAPGHIKTDLTPKREGFIESISEATPLKRLGEPEDVAYAVAFLVSDRADFITGQFLPVDGGHMLR